MPSGASSSAATGTQSWGAAWVIDAVAWSVRPVSSGTDPAGAVVHFLGTRLGRSPSVVQRSVVCTDAALRHRRTPLTRSRTGSQR